MSAHTKESSGSERSLPEKVLRSGRWVGAILFLTFSVFGVKACVESQSQKAVSGQHSSPSAASSETRQEVSAERPSLVVPAGIPCNAEGGVIATLAPGDSIVVDGSNRETVFSPDPSDPKTVITACSKWEPSKCITPETPHVSGDFSRWVVKNPTAQPQEVACHYK